jgi:hypothetical protein
VQGSNREVNIKDNDVQAKSTIDHIFVAILFYFFDMVNSYFSNAKKAVESLPMFSPAQTILERERARHAQRVNAQPRGFPSMVYTTYTSLPVTIPDNFLAPLPDPSVIKVKRVKFKDTPLSEYRDLYAVVLDNVLSQDECDQLLRMAEMSTGAHGNNTGGIEGKEIENNGWRPAMVNAGRNHEVLALHYRNSDRIIWDEKEVTTRLWRRVMQGEGMKEYFSVLDGEKYLPAIGNSATRPGERWVITEQGLNERMRFLKYGPGQFFKGKIFFFILQFEEEKNSNIA